ncbi:hypothetical protein RUND412_001755 [Rhizina undulata]
MGFNPADFRTRAELLEEGAALDVDFVGIVEKIGSEVEGFIIGERVAGYSPYLSLHTGLKLMPSVKGVSENRYGAFQEHIAVFPVGLIKLPAHIDIPRAATIGVRFSSAAYSLFVDLGLPQPPIPSSTPDVKSPPYDKTLGILLVWGGSSGTGVFTIQLAWLARVRVIAVTGKNNEEYVKSLGTEKVFSYDNIGRIMKHGFYKIGC